MIISCDLGVIELYVDDPEGINPSPGTWYLSGLWAAKVPGRPGRTLLELCKAIASDRGWLWTSARLIT